MEKIFDKNSLLQSSIFELRDIARSIGVCSPTIYKKEDLIDKIFKIVNDEEKPHIPKSRQGRPPKSLTGKNKIFDVLLPDDEEEKKFDLSDTNSIGVLNEELIAFLEDATNPVLNTERFVGCLDISTAGYGLIREAGNIYKGEKTVYVSDVQIKNYNLKSGDMLNVEARVLHKDKPMVMTVIKQINGRDYKNSIRNADFEKLPVEFPVRELHFEENEYLRYMPKDMDIRPVVCGSRSLVLVDKGKRFSSASLITALNTLKTGKFVYLGLELLPEITPLLQNIKGCESFYCMLDQSNVQQVSTASLALERAKRLVEEKNDVLLLIDSVDKIVKSENLYNNNNLTDIKKETFMFLKNMLAQPRSLSCGGSLTMILIMNHKTGNEFDATVLGEIENLCTNIFEI